MRQIISVIAGALLLSAPAQATISAQQTVEVEKTVTNADGTVDVVKVEADLVEPGETLFYSIAYNNEGADPANNVILVMNVPPEVTFVEGSASGTAIVTFSADNGSTYVARGRLTVNEGQATRAATGDDITDIKFTMDKPVAPQSRGKVSFRAILK